MIITTLLVFFESHLVNLVKRLEFPSSSKRMSFAKGGGQISVFLLSLIPKCLTIRHKVHYVERRSH